MASLGHTNLDLGANLQPDAFASWQRPCDVTWDAVP